MRINVLFSLHNIMLMFCSAAIDPAELSFPELDPDFDQNSGFDLYDRNEDDDNASFPRTPSDPCTPSDPPHTPNDPPHTPSDPRTPNNPLHPPSDPPHTPSNPPRTPSEPPYNPCTSLETGLLSSDQLQPRSNSRNSFSLSPQSPDFISAEHSYSSSTALQKQPKSPTSYCICRFSVWDSSMIKCHKCEGYFHGDCVGISRLKATQLKHFYCPLCIDKDPNLVTEFESKAEREAAEQKLKEEEDKKLYPTHKDVRKFKNKKHSRR